MIIGPDYIFYRMPKTAGTFLQNFLVDYLDGKPLTKSDGSHHVAIKHTPEEDKYKFSFGVIRNPWDWYVSNFFYLKRVNKDTEFLRAYMGGKTMEHAAMKDSIEALCYLDSTSHIWKMHIERPRYGISISEDRIKKWDFGHITMMYILHFFEDIERALNNNIDYIIKNYDDLISVDRLFHTESLAERFPEVMGLPNDLKDKFLTKPKENTSTHESYRTYYNKDLREIVAEREKLFTIIHGYQF